MANSAQATRQNCGGLRHFAETLRSARNTGLAAARSLGKWPRARTARRAVEFRLPIALAAWTARRIAAGNAKDGTTRSHAARQLLAMAGYFLFRACQKFRVWRGTVR